MHFTGKPQKHIETEDGQMQFSNAFYRLIIWYGIDHCKMYVQCIGFCVQIYRFDKCTFK